MKIILASNSPRRRELLTLSGYSFRTKTEPVDEESIQEQVLEELSSLPAAAVHTELVRRLAMAKAEAILPAHASLDLYPVQKLSDLPNFFVEGDEDKYVILGADTVVCLGDEILGKPHDPEEAEAMLRTLAGKTHLVHTGVASLTVSSDGVLSWEDSFVNTTEVIFLPLDRALESRIKEYVAGGEPMDKAGAYGIQDHGAVFVSGIKGDYYNVMGLPLSRVTRLLDRLNNGKSVPSCF